ncbi:MAG TPA: hypothetical protein VFM18_19800, partial [Methanosarcina sp.]|nr:hypothetical protein [Methanosarcina sp.]
VILLERTTEEVMKTSEQYQHRWAVEALAHDVTYKHLILKVFPEKWELYETEYVETIPQGGWMEREFDPSNYSLRLGI